MSAIQPENFDPNHVYRVMFNGVEVPVTIEPESDNELSPPQREALQLLLSLPSDILETAAPAVVQNYEIYREAIDDDEQTPPLATPAEVWKQVEPTSFDIPAHFDVTIPTFFLRAECDWDPEHGLEVRFRNGQADVASQQGDIGLTD